MADKRNANRILVGKRAGKRPVSRPKHRWMNNIKRDGEEWNGLE
jgi:hypothetical protein